MYTWRHSGGCVKTSHYALSVLAASTIAFSIALPTPSAFQQPAPAAGAPPAQAGRGGGIYPVTEPDDSAGFTPIFDGKTLNGWDGDLRYWRAEDGAIVGETTPTNVMKQNSFLIWRGGTVRDFELKLEFRMNGTNSG